MNVDTPADNFIRTVRGLLTDWFSALAIMLLLVTDGVDTTGVTCTAVSSACNGHGQCMNGNHCVCNADYTGPDCGISVCGGVICKNSAPCTDVTGSKLCTVTCATNACNGHGTCTDTNHCVCNAGFTGPECAVKQCGAVACTDAVACVTVNTVEYCTVSCVGANPCNGHGTCSSSSSGHCVCTGGYWGPRCEMAPSVCNGVACSSAVACIREGVVDYCPSTCSVGTPCNGQGSCSNTGGNHCICSAGFTGFDCAVTMCGGVTCLDAMPCLPNNFCNVTCSISTDCSNHGTCTGGDHCACTAGYGGPTCAMAATVCNGVTCQDHKVCTTVNNVDYCTVTCIAGTTACNAHGTCADNNHCVCNAGFTGPACATVATKCGIEFCSNNKPCTRINNVDYCTVSCTDIATACSGHGTCTNFNHCVCSAGYSGSECATVSCTAGATACSGHGTCVTNNHCACVPGYTGPQCASVDLTMTTPAAGSCSSTSLVMLILAVIAALMVAQ